ncbi:MAG: MFS transporter [Proteobacteria bacterium]|nr:MFS transporter [Pseudomonadota bacterium]
MAGLLFLFIVVNFADKVVLGLLAVPIMDELKFTPTEFGLIGSSFFWLFAISGVLGGVLADRVRTKWFLVVMALSWSLTQLPIVMGSTIAAFIVARVLLGVGEGPAWPVAVHACYSWFPNEKRNMPISLFTQGGALGLLLAGLVVPLVNLRWGWRAAFIGLAAFGLIWALVWMLVGREGPLDASRSGDSGAGHGQSLWRVVRDRTTWGTILMHFVSYWSTAGALTWLPAYFQRGLGFDNVASGRLYGLVVAITIPLALLGAWWSQRLIARGWSSRRARGRFSALWLIAAGLIFLLLLLPDLPPMARVASLAVGLALASGMAALVPAMLAQIAPRGRRGTLLALDNSLAGTAGILAPAIAGVLIQRHAGAWGFELGFILTGVLMLAGGVLGWFTVDPEGAMARFTRMPSATPGVAVTRKAAAL